MNLKWETEFKMYIEGSGENWNNLLEKIDFSPFLSEMALTGLCDCMTSMMTLQDASK